jgi:hypothetical protein
MSSRRPNDLCGCAFPELTVFEEPEGWPWIQMLTTTHFLMKLRFIDLPCKLSTDPRRTLK